MLQADGNDGPVLDLMVLDGMDRFDGIFPAPESNPPVSFTVFLIQLIGIEIIERLCRHGTEILFPFSAGLMSSGTFGSIRMLCRFKSGCSRSAL